MKQKILFLLNNEVKIKYRSLFWRLFFSTSHPMGNWVLPVQTISPKINKFSLICLIQFEGWGFFTFLGKSKKLSESRSYCLQSTNFKIKILKELLYLAAFIFSCYLSQTLWFKHSTEKRGRWLPNSKLISVQFTPIGAASHSGLIYGLLTKAFCWKRKNFWWDFCSGWGRDRTQQQPVSSSKFSSTCLSNSSLNLWDYT